MAYCTLDDLLEEIDSSILVELTDNPTAPTGQIDAEAVASAIRRADSIIDGYVGVRYAVPLETVTETFPPLPFRPSFQSPKQERIPPVTDDSERKVEVRVSGNRSIRAMDRTHRPGSTVILPHSIAKVLEAKGFVTIIEDDAVSRPHERKQTMDECEDAEEKPVSEMNRFEIMDALKKQNIRFSATAKTSVLAELLKRAVSE